MTSRQYKYLRRKRALHYALPEIAKAAKVIETIMFVAQLLRNRMKPIPRYRKGTESAIVGERTVEILDVRKLMVHLPTNTLIK